LESEHHTRKREDVVTLNKTLSPRRRKYSSPSSEGEDIGLTLLDSDTEDDEEISSKRENFVKEE